MHHWPHIVAILVGAGLAAQVGMNATLHHGLGSPIIAAIVNFCVGLALLVVIALIGGSRVSPGSAVSVPAWAWFGGLLGAAYVVGTTVAGPRLGAVVLLALTLAGQMLASMVVDHYGILGFPRSPVTASRLLGAVLLVAGVLLIMRR